MCGSNERITLQSKGLSTRTKIFKTRAQNLSFQFVISKAQYLGKSIIALFLNGQKSFDCWYENKEKFERVIQFEAMFYLVVLNKHLEVLLA